jgi:hypothetical protein
VQLTKGNRWPLLGLLIVLGIIVTLANLVAVAALALVGGVVGAALDFVVEGVLWTILLTGLAVSYAALREAKEGAPVEELAEVFS